ncbi:4Fe-4S binding protein [Pseudobacteroides cellulosolvens]|uniref:Nitrite and sulfite reductase 4Fe-4S region n=1 Tax=Pseudobacteroides cellulosolvens ATCC 35603 = DSM 2933 TaxID=398512 RepID=A0A0L6JQI1_9FIRM|nr:4Fe-4S binding protein [Pseudobacteroides cellulosolvens]KNY28044.1 nitrite and sulfite reductase 4Fe-4S region [Pseudobacteroides cellulosolvens ATCC 35603 = DSM 2933]
MAQVDYKELKQNGFIRQVDKEYFVLRIRVSGGQIQADKLQKVYELAQKYGRGYIHMTSRQSIEIPYIKLEDIEAVKGELKSSGMQTAASGARVRTITACQGSTICCSGLIDTTSLAVEFDEKYYGREIPHKFKLGITGCRNNCLKAEENDLGIKGAMKPKWLESKCNYCGLCEKVCREKSITVNKSSQTLLYDESGCNYCGRCVKSCPRGAWEGESGFVIYFGGLFGNRIAIGKQLFPVIFSTEQLHRVIGTTLEFFKKHGKPGERFRNTLDRIGWELLQEDLEKVFR